MTDEDTSVETAARPVIVSHHTRPQPTPPFPTVLNASTLTHAHAPPLNQPNHAVVLHRAAVPQLYRASDLALLRELRSADDEVNAAAFHPDPGGGIAYGTKEGRLCVVSRSPHLRWPTHDGGGSIAGGGGSGLVPRDDDLGGDDASPLAQTAGAARRTFDGVNGSGGRGSGGLHDGGSGLWSSDDEMAA